MAERFCQYCEEPFRGDSSVGIANHTEQDCRNLIDEQVAKPTFPIWLNIPLSKSSAFFKPLSICETLAVGMAIITP